MMKEELRGRTGTWENQATGEITYETWHKDIPDGKTSSYGYEKNTRYEVKKGTRCVSVNLSLSAHEGRTFTGRTDVTAAATAEAAATWTARWGEIPWDFVSILVSHVTAQVVVEFRVEGP